MSNSQAIIDLTIQDLEVRGPQYVPGWTFLPEDLNKGVGGHYIYLGFKRGDGSPVTSLDFKAYSKEQQDNPNPDWNWNRVDLNRGAGGKYIYMFWKNGEPGKSPITGLMIILSNQKTPYNIAGWTHTGVDLNKGAGGPYIWAYYSTTLVSP